MNRKKAKQLLWTIMFMLPTYSGSADKVVIIPLGGDEAPASKVVFVTKGAWNGNLGGASGADGKCQAEADAQGSKVQGLPFKAWISGGLATDFSAGSRSFTMSELPYKLVNGILVANNFSGFVSGGSLLSNLDMYADGLYVDGFIRAWTGIDNTGHFASIQDCDSWLSDAPTSTVGFFGRSNAVTPAWTLSGSSVCGSSRHLYCFEQ